MIGLLSCACYIALIGGVSFVLGRIVPKSWFHWDKAPFAAYGFERQGKLYEKLGIRYWQKKLPDMSRILPGTMPAKKIGGDYKARLPQMLRETCVAELTHWLLCVAGLHCLTLWPTVGGLAVVLLNTLGNLPFILIQRYNRPRLARLLEKTGGTAALEQETCQAD